MQFDKILYILKMNVAQMSNIILQQNNCFTLICKKVRLDLHLWCKWCARFKSKTYKLLTQENTFSNKHYICEEYHQTFNLIRTPNQKETKFTILILLHYTPPHLNISLILILILICLYTTKCFFLCLHNVELNWCKTAHAFKINPTHHC